MNREILGNAVKNSKSCEQVLRILKLAHSQHSKITNLIKKYNCDTTHWRIQPLSNLLIINKKYTSLTSLKTRILKAGLLKYECGHCGIKEWLGNPITLELDHVNGISHDNRIENFRLLCPTCHSQTPTYGAKNKKKRFGPKRPTKKQLNRY